MAIGNKHGRLEVIKMIVASQEVSTQEKLLAELDIAGFPTSQATLVRDLRQLHIIKGQNRNGNYVYLMPTETRYRVVSDEHPAPYLNRRGTLSIKFTGNLAVIKTMPGYADRIAIDIDTANIEEVMGTIAGDDTVFVALREDADKAIVMDRLMVFTGMEG